MTILTAGVTPGRTLWVILSDDTVRILRTIIQSDRRKSLPRSAVNPDRPDHLSGPALLPQVPLFATLLPLAEATEAIELVQPDQRVQRRLPSVGRGNVQIPRDLFLEEKAELHFEVSLDERCRHAEEADHKTWGSKVDQVTAEQVKNVSPALSVPGESASEPNREFQRINVHYSTDSCAAVAPKWARELIGKGIYARVSMLR